MTDRLLLRLCVAGQAFSLECQGESPRSQAALAALLPLDLQLHTPKIAGSHIYWHAPLLQPLEGARAVLDAPPGTFLYWPVRQFLEITYAPLQAETAAVTVLGRLLGPVAPIAALAARLRENQGRQIFGGALCRAPGQKEPQTGTQPDAVALGDVFGAPGLAPDLGAACRALWQGCPPEITALARGRALMHPAGPMFTAESEARVLHETLWTLADDRASGALQPDLARAMAGFALRRAAGRLRDFCHFEQLPALLLRLGAALGPPPYGLGLGRDPALDLAIVTAGRIAAWLDLQIPWNDLNQAFRAAQSAPALPSPHSKDPCP